MPEVAEVHLNSDVILKPYLKNKQLKDLKIISGKYLRSPPIDYHEFLNSLPTRIKSINTEGKFIWMTLGNGWIIGCGLGLTGRFSIHSDIPNIRLEFITSDDTVYYSDARNFGNIYLWNSVTPLKFKIESIGYDLLDHEPNRTDIIDLFRTMDSKDISSVLLSQKVLAGVGNYLRNEGLYEAKIYPYAKVKNLSDEDLMNLYDKLRAEARKAYRYQKKEFIMDIPYDRYQTQMKIYKHQIDPFGNKIRRDTGNLGADRTTFWVPQIQIKGK